MARGAVGAWRVDAWVCAREASCSLPSVGRVVLRRVMDGRRVVLLRVMVGGRRVVLRRVIPDKKRKILKKYKNNGSEVLGH